MPTASMFNQAVFVAIVLGVAAVFCAGVRCVGRDGPLAPRTAWWLASAVIVFWLLVPGVLACRGDLDRYAPVPPPGFMLFALWAAVFPRAILSLFLGFSKLEGNSTESGSGSWTMSVVLLALCCLLAPFS